MALACGALSPWEGLMLEIRLGSWRRGCGSIAHSFGDGYRDIEAMIWVGEFEENDRIDSRATEAEKRLG